MDTGSFIGEEAAKAAALADAGVQESATTYCSVWLDYDDGWPECYEVEFMADNTRYEYKIALTSAAVLEQKQERIDQSRDKILREANEKAREILQEAKDTADETIRIFQKAGPGA